MKEKSSDRIAILEEKLWREFHADVIFPPGLPEKIRLGLVERMMVDLERARRHPESAMLRALSPDMTMTLDFCPRWCGGCGLQRWCQTPDEYPSVKEWEEQLWKMAQSRESRVESAIQSREN